ncbi:MAG: hypothetical protein MK066_15005, partial [Crocinitomicaceae bacterium]|nr:hypothetical protein [Crocinitomicaceae bacterium]
MRKVYLAALSLVTGLFAFGQTETIVAHTAPSMLSFPNGSFTIFSNASGYLSGTANLAIPTEGIVQKFDMSTGIQANGTIDAVRMWIPVKADAGNGTTVDVVLYEDNGGVPGTVIASQTVSIANIDTAVLSTNILNDGVNATGAYNLEVTFA